MIASTLLMALNVGFFIGGGAILALGILSKVKPEIVYQLTGYLTNSLGNVFSDLEALQSFDLNALIEKNAYILIAIGGFLFLFGFLGFCGAMRKSSMLLTVYAYLVLAILCGEAALGVYGYMYADKLEIQIQDVLKLTVNQYKEGVRIEAGTLKIPDGGADIAWDAAQMQLKCCGVIDYKDWQKAAAWNSSYTFPTELVTLPFPPSCCTLKDDALQKDINNLGVEDFENIVACTKGTPGTYNEVGCYMRIKGLFLDNKTIIIAVLAVVVLVEVLAIGCACWMKNNIK